MKIIISPAKKMRDDYDFPRPRNAPVFLGKAQRLASYLRGLSLEELKKLLACNEQLALLNYERYQMMDLERDSVNPAILSYDGIQYKYMAPQVFEQQYYEYTEEHLRILSGLYGILRPLDGVTPYRLEMQTKLQTSFCMNLYDYWGSSIHEEVTRNESVILNLASEEYAKVVKKYLREDVSFITCIFGELENEKIKEKGVYVKMARGEMVRYMAENSITGLEHIKEFNRLGFLYQDELSDKNNYVFIR